MKPTSFHIHIGVRGALADLQRSRRKMSYYTDANGQELTRLQAIESLEESLKNGHECLPTGQCANPCGYSKACKGFNYGQGGGCPGHPIEDTEKSQ